jgi:hypothetical protein
VQEAAGAIGACAMGGWQVGRDAARACLIPEHLVALAAYAPAVIAVRLGALTSQR